MTTATVKVARVQRIVDVVEEILVDIAEENAEPYAAAPAMVEFFMDLQQRIARISHERLVAFMQQKQQPGD